MSATSEMQNFICCKLLRNCKIQKVHNWNKPLMSCAVMCDQTHRLQWSGNKLVSTWSVSCETCPVCAWERCRISPPRFLVECHMRRLNQGSFVLLYFCIVCFFWVVFSFCSVSVFLVCLLCCIFQCVPMWTALTMQMCQ